MADYNFRDYWTDFDLLTKAILRRLLQANDEFGNPRMRKAILDDVNEMRRFCAGRFVKLGVLTDGESQAYYRIPDTEGTAVKGFNPRPQAG